MTTGPAGRLRASRTPDTARRLGARWSARASCGAAFPEPSDAGSPSSSQNICALVPRGHPSAGITGELWSQPPLGVAETRLPKRSATSRWTVSPRVGSPAPTVSGASTTVGSRPPPGRSSPEAASPTSRRRSSLYSAREQAVERHVDEARVAVERLPVGERELRALDDRVDVLGRADAEGREVEPGEQGELLQQDRPLPPRPGLADRVAVVVVGDRRLDRRLPAGEIAAGDETAVRRAEAVDLVGDEATIEGVSSPVDPVLAAPGAGLVEDSPIGRGERRVAKERSRPRCREVQLRRRPARSAEAARSARSSQ